MRTALVSMAPAWEDAPTNLTACAAYVRRAAELGAALVAFPEMTLTGFTMNAGRVAESADGSPSVRAFGELARDHGVHIAFGVVLEGRERPRNTAVVVAPDGGEVARYAKVHPFPLAGEDRAYEAGEELVVAAVRGARLGLSICYDLRFPALYAAQASEVDAFLVIANWPAARIAHWRTLLCARAIESQAYILGVNRTGTDGNGLEYPPSTLVFDPTGAGVEPVASDGDLAVFDVNPDAVAAYRSAFPVLRDVRRDVYVRG
jgi:predicted amidohydrolase